MRKWLVMTAALAVGATAAGMALASNHTGATGTAVVKTYAKNTVSINRYFQDGMRFAPGTVTVKSGATLTFVYGDREQEPHSLTIVSKADLPKTIEQVENCAACGRLASAHLKNPRAEPGPANPIVHWTLNRGPAGLDEPGDSVAIFPGAHKSISVKVSAKPGTTLYFLCALHPWMQGKIVVR